MVSNQIMSTKTPNVYFHIDVLLFVTLGIAPLYVIFHIYVVNCYSCHENQCLTHSCKTSLYGEECLLFINSSQESYLSNVGLNPTDCWPLTIPCYPRHCAYICNTINKRNQVVHYCIDTLHFLFGLNLPIPEELHSSNPKFSLDVSKV